MLHVGSYNIHRCVGGDRRCDPARIAQVIQEMRCDTIGLQEVDNHGAAGDDSMQLDYLARATGMTAIAGPTIVHHAGHYGNALLTRRPVLAVRRYDISYRGFEPRGALEIELDAEGHVVHVWVMHLGLYPAERRFQVKKVLSYLREIPMDRAVVVLGDINEWLPLSRPLRWLHELLGQPPWQRSFPVWAPLFALDRVWVRPRGSLTEFSVHRSALARRASDHYPVKALVSSLAVPLRKTRE